MTEVGARIPLGGTGMEITRVGFGAWAVGGGDWAYAWGAQDDESSIAAIRHAVESGINWIDTAAVYGLGHSEEVVARALEPYSDRERPYVFTKGGLIWGETGGRRDAPSRVGDPASLRREVERSLRRLRVERIDLYQMHWPADDGTALEDYWATFLNLRDEGKIAAAGLSNHDSAQLDIAERLGHVDTLQPPLSAIEQDATESLLPWALDHGTGVVVYSPMGSGLLTGAFDAARVAALADDDWRKHSPAFTTHLAANLRVTDALAFIAQRHSVSPGAAAVAWALAVPGVTAAIVGARTAAQVDGWIKAPRVALDESDLALVAAARRPS